METTINCTNTTTDTLYMTYDRADCVVTAYFRSGREAHYQPVSEELWLRVLAHPNPSAARNSLLSQLRVDRIH